LALLVVSAELVAVTVAEVALETVGAVNFPSSVMLPIVVDQVTDVLLVPLTNALNCWVPADDTLALAGETEMPTLLLVEALLTARVNVPPERVEEESVTSSTILNRPVTVGVPEMVPLELRVKPAGSGVQPITNRYGAFPPLTESVEL
jgi:hypothetical protein